METKLKVIAETADITQEEAKLAFDLADGDIERALTLIPFVEKLMIVIHGKFICGRNTKLHGIFRLLGNGKEGQLLDFGLAMSYTQSDIDSPISSNPEAFKKVIDELFKQTENSQVHSFLSGFYSYIGAAQINQMYHFLKEKKMVELKGLFSDLIGKIWGGSERVEVELETFQLTKVQCEKKGLLLNEVSSNEEDTDADPNLTIYLESEPIISAVKGKTIDKFSVGEMIPLRIVDEREVGNYLGQVLSDDFGIAVARLSDFYFKELSGRYVVTVEFGPKINGKFMVEPSVRLSSFEDIPKQENIVIDDDPSPAVNPLFFMLVGIILGILFFVILSR